MHRSNNESISSVKFYFWSPGLQQSNFDRLKVQHIIKNIKRIKNEKISGVRKQNHEIFSMFESLRWCRCLVQTGVLPKNVHINTLLVLVRVTFWLALIYLLLVSSLDNFIQSIKGSWRNKQDVCSIHWHTVAPNFAGTPLWDINYSALKNFQQALNNKKKRQKKYCRELRKSSTNTDKGPTRFIHYIEHEPFVKANRRWTNAWSVSFAILLRW